LGLKLKEPLYLKNQAKFKIYGHTLYKLIRFNSLRNNNVSSVIVRRPKGTVNEDKLDNNISRARSKIKEYVLCNEWQYFTTFTIDKTKFDRYNLEKYHKAFSQWIRDYNKKYSTNVKYITIPEQHEDGAWHEHGFIMGIPLEHLRLFTLEEKLPYIIREKLLKGEKVYNWVAYSEKFGFNDFEPIKSLEAAANYVMKYITKDLSKSVKDINAHMHYNSKGLETSKVIKKGTMSANIAPDFENDYIKINEYPANTPRVIIEGILSTIE